MSTLAFARLQLAVAALLFGGAGLAFLVSPGTLGAIGIELGSVNASGDVRAVYGGLEIGLGLFLAYCALDPARIPLGVLASLGTLGGMVLARGLSALVDGAPSGIGWLLWGAEAACAGLALAAWLRVRGA